MADPLSYRRSRARTAADERANGGPVERLTPLENNGAEPSNIPLKLKKGAYVAQTPLDGNGAQPSNIPLSEVEEGWSSGSPPGRPLASAKGGPPGRADRPERADIAFGGGGREVATTGSVDPLDSAQARELHKRLLSWFYYERDRQAMNRLEMAIDHDFYDGEQWDEETLATLEGRRQLPVVYNEVAPMCDWMIGTERRNKVDWRVLPRSADDVQTAEVKTNVLKYVADINHVTHQRSRAFGDAVKVGVGWLEDGVRSDPLSDPLYSRYEDWRCVLHDSAAFDYLGEEGRYNYKWRWVDEDVAVMMFPRRAHKIRRAAEDWADDIGIDEELDWQSPNSDATMRRSGTLSPLAGTTVAVEATRRRVRLIECQYREPMIVKFIADGPLKGTMFDLRDKPLVETVAERGYSLVDRVTMRVHVAVFTEADMLAMGPSIYRHNRFSRTPIFCYLRGRDKQPYGMIRRVRTVQQDINKRASKANWLINTNQLIGDADAFEDWEQAREEAQDPQGVLPVKPGRKIEIRRDADAARGQLEMMNLGVQSIQRNSVSNENLGRETNATSEVAIRARQLQGSVTTTEPFDNLRLAVQAQGEKQLSLIEQFYTEEKALRLTGAKGQGLRWLKINEPELQPDGSVRFLNDIAASAADFVVSDADYAGTLRQVMFDSLMQLSQRLPPEVALKLLRMAFDYSDLPNKDDIAAEIRKLTGEPDATKQPTPEEQAELEQAAQAQAEAAQIARETALAALEEQRGKARTLNAQAEKVMAEIEALRTGAGDGGDSQTSAELRQLEIERAVAQVRERAATQIDALSQKLAKLVADREAAMFQARTQADSQAETARISAASAERVAEIQAESTKALDALTRKLDALTDELKRTQADAQQQVKALERQVADAAKAAEQAAKDAQAAAAAQAAAPAPAAPSAPSEPPAAPPITVNVQVDAKGDVKKSIVVKRDEAGNLVGEVKPAGAKE